MAVALGLYAAVHARLVLLAPDGSQAVAVELGASLPEAATHDVVVEVLRAGDPVAVRAGATGGVLGWVGAPVRDGAGRTVGALVVATAHPALDAADLSGLTALAGALGARLELVLPLPPARAAVPVQPTRRSPRAARPGPALVDRDRLLGAGDAALRDLRALGCGAAAALVLHVHTAPGTVSAAARRSGVVARLRGQLRPGDLLARIEDDAYAVLLPDLPAGARYVALGVADRLGRSLTDPVGAPSGLVGASSGLAFCAAGRDDDAVDAVTLLARAERAAQVARRRGTGTFHVHRDAVPVDTSDDAHVERLLRTALDERSLVVHYQPVVGLSSRGVVGVEALVRLRGPGGSLVPPDRFIAIAERAGLIGALGDQVRRTAMTTVAQWKRELPADRTLNLGVNLSVRELGEDGLVASVRAALADSGLPPEALSLEITESAFMDEGRGHEQVLAELRGLGPKLFIDDFGTGFSSLSYLRRFPVDGLKIDRTFVGDLLSGPQPAAVTAAIVHLAQELGVHVVAEGVETEQQAEVLVGHGCRLAQGYLFSRPQPAEAVQPLLLPVPRPALDEAVALVR